MPTKAKPIKQELNCGYPVKNTIGVCKAPEGKYIYFCTKGTYYSHKHLEIPNVAHIISMTDRLTAKLAK